MLAFHRKKSQKTNRLNAKRLNLLRLPRLRRKTIVSKREFVKATQRRNKIKRLRKKAFQNHFQNQKMLLKTKTQTKAEFFE